MSAALRERGITSATGANINSSTGPEGLRERQFRRAYNNTDPILRTGQFIDTVRATTRLAGRALRTDGRAVVRGFVAPSVIEDVVGRRDNLAANLEVAVPVDGEWYTVWAQNGKKRGPINPVEHMVEATSEYDKEPNTARINMKKALDQGFTFVSDVSPQMESQVLRLWGKTFGWDETQVSNLAENLREQKEKPAHERTLWFTGVMEGDRLVAANMAERANVSSKKGNKKVVESTEWKVLNTEYDEQGEVLEQGYEGRGLMQAAVAVTNVQILEDLGIEDTFIYAECNFATRADIAAQRAGMTVPPRSFSLNGSGEVKVADQVMVGNVGINDKFQGIGYPMVEGGQQFELRDFVFTYLDPLGARDYYGFEDRYFVRANLVGRRELYEASVFSGPQEPQTTVGVY